MKTIAVVLGWIFLVPAGVLVVFGLGIASVGFSLLRFGGVSEYDYDTEHFNGRTR